MKYDVIVVGAGPAGLMAARTAAEDGLKVVLVERKKDLYEVNRLCGQLTNINMKNVGGQVKYGYTERLNLEIGTDVNRVHYPDLGFSIDYDGPIRPYLNYIHFSPGGQRVYREKDHCFAFFWDKRKLIAGLIEATLKAGVEIITEARADSVTNTGTGVKLTVTMRTGAVELEARKLIAADGKDSRIVEGLGLNRQRQLLGPRGERIVGYVLEGVADECRINSWVCFTVPSLSPMANIWMFLAAGDRNVVGTMVMGDRSPVQITEGLMRLPAFSPWFRHAKLVRKLATASVTRTPIADPVAGNVLIIGDAAAMVETSNPGAIACGYQAARATLAEINQGSGYREYVRWWQNSFDFNHPTYLKGAGRFFAINALCSDAEVDYLYALVGDQIGVPGALIGDRLDEIKRARPELHRKMSRAGVGRNVAGVKLELDQVLKEQV